MIADTGSVKPCPNCGEQIKAAARVCRYCHRRLDEAGQPVVPLSPVASPSAVSYAGSPLIRAYDHVAVSIEMASRGAKLAATVLVLAILVGGSFLVLRATDGAMSLPLIGGGPSADSIFEDMQGAGLPITDGVPADPEYAAMARDNKCEDSRPFVRSDSDKGWGVICIGLTPTEAEGIYNAFDGMPQIMAPLYADAEGRDVIVFGLGWPEEGSRIVHDALDDSSGSFLTSS